MNIPDLHDPSLRMPDILGDMTNEIARKLAADQDALIRRNITRRIGEDWTDASILPRLRWEIDRSKPEKMLLLDDKPLLLIWPVDCDGDDDDAVRRDHKYEAIAHAVRWRMKYLEIP